MARRKVKGGYIEANPQGEEVFYADEPKVKPPRPKGQVSAKDPAREELRNKQLAEDPVFAEQVRQKELEKQEVIRAEVSGETEQQKIIKEERTRLTEEESPERTEILNQPSGLEQVPVVGPLFSKVLDLIPFQNEEAKTRLSIDPIEQRTAALTKISEQEIDRGLTNNEKFGEWVEAIPVIGGLTAKYASGLIETPSSNTREITKNVLAEKRRLTNIETNVKLGYMSIETAQDQVNDIEENVVRLESRMKLLINSSPQLKFNSDGVNTIETKILQTKEKILQAKQNIITGKTNDPTELQIYQQLSAEEDIE